MFFETGRFIFERSTTVFEVSTFFDVFHFLHMYDLKHHSYPKLIKVVEAESTMQTHLAVATILPNMIIVMIPRQAAMMPPISVPTQKGLFYPY